MLSLFKKAFTLSILLLTFRSFSSEFDWSKVALAPIPVGTMVQLLESTSPPKTFTERAVFFGEIGFVAEYDEASMLYRMEDMEGKLISHKPLSALKVIGEGLKLIQAPFQACETLLSEHAAYSTKISQTRVADGAQDPIRFIHIGQDHSRPGLKESNDSESKMTACASQVAIYEKLMSLHARHPDMLVFHEQFMFREKREGEYLLRLIAGNSDLASSSFEFEQSLLGKYRKFFTPEKINSEFFDLFSPNLRSSVGDFMAQMAWQEWYGELLELKRPEESGALYLFQGEKYSQMRGRFRPTNTEDKSLLITENLQILLESGFKLLEDHLEKDSFLSVLKLFRKAPWSPSLQDLAKKTLKLIKSPEISGLEEVFQSFKKQVLEEIHQSFVASFREEEALRQVNKYVALERPSTVVFVYGLAHDIEKQAGKHLAFPFSYEYATTSSSETELFLTPLEEISRKELSGRVLTAHEAKSKRRWTHIRPQVFIKSRTDLEQAYFKVLKSQISGR